MLRRRSVVFLLTALAVLAPMAVVTAVTAAKAAPDPDTAATATTSPHAGHVIPSTLGSSRPPAAFVRDGGPSFNLRCTLSHARADDPIVAPGQFGASHLHVFFGNRVMDADTTFAEATGAGAGTSCNDKGDTAGYWIPELRVGGKAIAPSAIRPYYYAQAADHAQLRAFPPDLRVVAGDRAATSAQNPNVIKWLCRPISHQGDTIATRIPDEPACPGSAYLSLGIRFPDCWDGRNLDSPDHKRHMAYSSAKRRCPASHPVKLPRLRISVTWKTSGGTSAVTLSSGNRHGMHGDFWNTWNQSVLERKVAGLRK